MICLQISGWGTKWESEREREKERYSTESVIMSGCEIHNVCWRWWRKKKEKKEEKNEREKQTNQDNPLGSKPEVFGAMRHRYQPAQIRHLKGSRRIWCSLTHTAITSIGCVINNTRRPRGSQEDDAWGKRPSESFISSFRHLLWALLSVSIWARYLISVGCDERLINIRNTCRGNEEQRAKWEGDNNQGRLHEVGGGLWTRRVSLCRFTAWWVMPGWEVLEGGVQCWGTGACTPDTNHSDTHQSALLTIILTHTHTHTHTHSHSHKYTHIHKHSQIHIYGHSGTYCIGIS